MSMTASGKASKVQTKRQLTLLENALEGVFEREKNSLMVASRLIPTNVLRKGAKHDFD
ncbi:hypothetical protein L484_004176 [Morus notabilis]|uniref:Uncharacterized protein n=1 Tax=Morus notabilis TaxID=981085 RepID=W9QBZ2_9ROSA|nr:hypothetical protein L484_004176 [Morus notabilis]